MTTIGSRVVMSMASPVVTPASVTVAVTSSLSGAGGSGVGDERLAARVGGRGGGEGAGAVVGEGDRLVVDEVAGEADAEGDGAAGGDGAADRVGEGAGAGTAGVELEPFADGDREASLLEDGAEDGVGAAGVEVDGELELVGAELARASGEAEEAVARRLGGNAREPVAERDRGAGVAAPEDDLGADLEEVVAVAGESGCVLDRGDLDVDARAGEVGTAGERPVAAACLCLLDREAGQVDGARDPDHVAEGSAGEVGAEATLELAAGDRGGGVGRDRSVEGARQCRRSCCRRARCVSRYSCR